MPSCLAFRDRCTTCTFDLIILPLAWLHRVLRLRNSRGVVDKYKLRMKKFNEPTSNSNPHVSLGRSGILKPSSSLDMNRSNSVSQRSTSSATQQPSDSSDNGAGTSVTTTNRTKPRRRFGLRIKSTERRALSPPGQQDVDPHTSASEGDPSNGNARSASRIGRPNFLKGRSMSNTTDHQFDQLLADNRTTVISPKKRLNLNGFLSGHYLGTNKDQHAKFDPRSILSRSASTHKESQDGTLTPRLECSQPLNSNSLGSTSRSPRP